MNCCANIKVTLVFSPRVMSFFAAISVIYLLRYTFLKFFIIIIITDCARLNANEIQIPHDKHQKVSSLVKSHQNTHNSVKYEVI